MSTEQPATDKPAKTFDSAYGFSFAIAIGLILFIAGLVISLTIGGGTSLGLIFGIPLLFAGLAVPLFMMRDQFKTSAVVGPCPHCGAPIKTSDATIRLECPECHGLIVVKEMKLYQAESK
jgi:DNA-directed RNA polymerase subunit RPC12/RpoP